MSHQERDEAIEKVYNEKEFLQQALETLYDTAHKRGRADMKAEAIRATRGALRIIDFTRFNAGVERAQSVIDALEPKDTPLAEPVELSWSLTGPDNLTE